MSELVQRDLVLLGGEEHPARHGDWQDPVCHTVTITE